MKVLKIIRLTSWTVTGAICFLILAIALGWFRQEVAAPQSPSEELSPMLSLGGSFIATDHHGKPFSEKNILGRPTLMFFGFTSCPNICPTTLSELTNILEKLGSDANRLNVVFVSVDPERDTINQMADYLTAFDKKIIGLTLTSQELEVMSKKYRFYYKKVPIERGDYTMDHTSGVYMLEADGKFRGVLDLHEPEVTKMQKVHMLIGQKP